MISHAPLALPFILRPTLANEKRAQGNSNAIYDADAKNRCIVSASLVIIKRIM